MTATQRPTRLRQAVPRPAPQPAPTRAPLRVVGPRELSPQARLRRARLIRFSAVILVVLVVFGVVVEHAILAQQQFRLAQLQERVSQEQSTNQALSLQVAQLSSPERIVSEAQSKLGMVSPPNITYLVPGASGAKVKGQAAATTTTTTPAPTTKP